MIQNIWFEVALFFMALLFTITAFLVTTPVLIFILNCNGTLEGESEREREKEGEGCNISKRIKTFTAVNFSSSYITFSLGVGRVITL